VQNETLEKYYIMREQESKGTKVIVRDENEGKRDIDRH